MALLRDTLGRVENILNQHGNGHGTNSTGDGGNLGSNLDSRAVLNITNKSFTGLFGGIGNVVDTDINDNGTGLEPLTLDKFGDTNRRKKTMSASSDNAGNVLGTAVTHSYGCVSISQEV